MHSAGRCLHDTSAVTVSAAHMSKDGGPTGASTFIPKRCVRPNDERSPGSLGAALEKKWKTEIKMAQFAQRPLEGLQQKKRSVFIINRRQLGFAMNQETSVLLQEFVIVSVTNWAHPM